MDVRPEKSKWADVDIRVQDHFPLVLKECKKEAAVFFHCFTTHGEITGSR